MTETLRFGKPEAWLPLSFLLTLLASAVWVESDAYRYVLGVLYVWGLLTYLRSDDRPPPDWVAATCMAWAAYVAIRIGLAHLAEPDVRHGTSEGIYLLPIVYSMMGFVILRGEAALKPTVYAFMAVSLVALIATVPFATAFDGGTHDFLFTDNTIHSSVGGGFILIASLSFAAWCWRAQPHGTPRTLLLAAAYTVTALCAVGLLAAKSKGVWAAIAVAVALQMAIVVAGRPGRGGILAATAALAAILVATVAVRDDLWAHLGPTFEASAEIADVALDTGSPLAAMQAFVDSPSVPLSLNERLKLWSNALEAWAARPIVGLGADWEAGFRAARYGDVGYNLLHNGYLEVGIRYGLLGLVFYVGLYAWTCIQSRRAAQSGLIAYEAYVLHLTALAFFAVTLLSNSNNRLAIGESYMLVAAGFGFYCYFKLSRQAVESAQATDNRV